MQERIVGSLVGGLRLVLVVAAVAVAVVPIGRSLLTGFCPPVEGATATVTVASASVTTSVLASVATDAEPTDGVTGTDDPTTAVPTDQPGAGTDGASAPATDGTTDGGTPVDGTTVTEEDPACAGGADRCFPPLISAVVSFGSGPCGGEALAILRGSMLPAFLLATALLAGAWALRPRHGGAVLSRF